VYQIALVNMPFAAADLPSIALAQLKAILGRELGGQVRCKVLNPNLDLFNYLGGHFYELVSNSVLAHTSGLGDWFFSEVAFPGMPDNSETYLLRHFNEYRAELDALREHLVGKRRTVGPFLDQLIDSCQLDKYSLVGFTSMFCQNVACFAMARKLKERNPKIVTVMGGANCETPMGNVIARNVPWIDFVCSGPALRSFPELVRHLAAGDEGECHAIGGIISKQKVAAHPEGNAREIGEELDIDVEVPLDYDDYFAEVDRKLQDTRLDFKIPFETSRGCWWGERSHCTFCGLNGVTMKYRAMQPAKALALLHGLFERYGPRAALFQSVDNILPREYLTEVLPHLDTPEDVELFWEVKADLKEREIAVLARARATRIQPGIEAIATSTLKLMRKGTTSFQNIKFLKHCRQHHVGALWNLLVGFPDEPEEVYRKYCEDLPLLMHLEPPSGAHSVRFDRFSPYHMQAKEYGLELKPFDFYEMIYPFPASELGDLAYFFMDQDYHASYLTTTAKWLGKLRGRVDHWQTRWQQRDHRLKPTLAWKDGGGGRVVYDSRSGSAVEHEVGALGARVLEILNEQHRIQRLAEKLADVPAAEVEGQVAALRQRGLVFEEDGLYLSLVVKPAEEEPLPLWQPVDAAEQFNFV
jgi:ribosomal peptide maturation radical SAM protein 1